MNATIENTARLSALVKHEVDTSVEGWQTQVLLSFVSKDFDIFSTRFRDEELGPLLKLERDDSDSFYRMLAYFYVRATNFNFYVKGLSHAQRSAALIEPIGEMFIKTFRGNNVAERMTHIYSDSEIYNAEVPILWNAVTSFALMLESFANPKAFREYLGNTYLLPGLGQRSYWRGAVDDDTLILMLANSGELPGSGYYDVFHIDRRTARCSAVCKLSFLSDKVLSLVDATSKRYCLGGFEYDGETISYYWEHEYDNPTRSGNLWHLLPLRNSASLRALDKAVSDKELTRTALLSEGSQKVEGMEVTDVIISRSRLQICLENGETYSIDRNTVPFLRQISPDMPVGLFRRIEDGNIYAVWLTLKQTIPLSLFNKQ